MKRKKTKKTTDKNYSPDTMRGIAETFFEWLAIKNYSPATIQNRKNYLHYFFNWCEERELIYPSEITKPIIERYQKYLYHYRQKRTGEPLTFGSQHTHICPIKAFFKWLTKQNYILYNPASEIDLPRLEKRLPKFVLTDTEAEKVLNLIDITTDIGIRNRAILEAFYSSGMRRAELVNLKIFDIDAERGVLVIRQGKGKKDRTIPIGDRALEWIEKYVDDVRPKFVIEPDNSILFLSEQGEALSKNRLTQMVRNYVNAADLGKKGACHLFRHTMSTLMLENGADIRFIQEMLGHADLSTTQIYAQVSIRQLKQVHTLTHPAQTKPTKTKKIQESEKQENEKLKIEKSETENLKTEIPENKNPENNKSEKQNPENSEPENAN